ncbi:unnamed protein product [Calypogeia fissa]
MSNSTPYPVVGHQQEGSADESTWSELSSDLSELIFSKLPEASVCRAASVCKRWYSVTQMPTFCEFYKLNKNANLCTTFVYMVNDVNYIFAEIPDGKGGFMFQPVEKRPNNVPTVWCSEEGHVPTTEVAGGAHIAYTGVKQTVLRYKLSLVEKQWRTTPEMPYFVQDPIVGVVERNSLDGSGHKLIVAGGLPIYSDVDDDLVVTIYDEKSDSWGYCDPLPSKFRSCASSLFMAAVVCKGRFYAYDMYSGLVSWLDVDSKKWSPVVALRPSRKVNQVFLVSRSGALCLVGAQGNSEPDIRFTVWSVEDEAKETMRLGEIVYSNMYSNISRDPPSTIQRWTSSFMETSSAIVGVLLLLLIQLLIHWYKMANRAYAFLEGLQNSTGIAVMKQKHTIRAYH